LSEQEHTRGGTGPEPGRLQTEESYGVPESEEGMLPWSYVEERMSGPRNYWAATVRPDGRPPAVPVSAVWLDGTFPFGVRRRTRKARNLAVNPHLVVHLESGDDVVILEGAAEEITDPSLLVRIDDAYEAKDGIRHGTSVWALRPRVAYAWNDFPKTARPAGSSTTTEPRFATHLPGSSGTRPDHCCRAARSRPSPPAKPPTVASGQASRCGWRVPRTETPSKPAARVMPRVRSWVRRGSVACRKS
jgi:Pyridoxamine 5'-phosphate oxidase